MSINVLLEGHFHLELFMLVFSEVQSGAYSINTACNRPSAQRLQFRCYCYTHKRNTGTYIKAAKLQSPYMHAHKGRQPGEARKRQRQQEQTNKKPSTHWHAPVTSEACWNWVTCVYLFCSFLDTQIAPWMGAVRAPQSAEAEYVHFYVP